MKNNLQLVIAIALAASIFSSCEKESIMPEVTSNANSNGTPHDTLVPTYTDTSIQIFEVIVNPEDWVYDSPVQCWDFWGRDTSYFSHLISASCTFSHNGKNEPMPNGEYYDPQTPMYDEYVIFQDEIKYGSLDLVYINYTSATIRPTHPVKFIITLLVAN